MFNSRKKIKRSTFIRKSIIVKIQHQEFAKDSENNRTSLSCSCCGKTNHLFIYCYFRNCSCDIHSIIGKNI